MAWHIQVTIQTFKHVDWPRTGPHSDVILCLVTAVVIIISFCLTDTVTTSFYRAA